MHRRLTILFVLLVPLVLPALPASAGESLEDVFRDFNLAFQQGDLDRVSARIADDYLHTNGGQAPIGRREWLAWYAGLASRLTGGEARYDRYDVSEVQIRKSVETLALVTARYEVERNERGSRLAFDVRTTQVWRDRNGRWERVAFHDAPVAESETRGGAQLAVQRALTQDEILGTVRNEACRELPIAEVIADYVRAMDFIDLEACPNDFILAFRAHRDAWHASIEFFSEFDDLRGEMHEVFELIRARDRVSRSGLESREAAIWGTWSEVEQAVESIAAAES